MCVCVCMLVCAANHKNKTTTSHSNKSHKSINNCITNTTTNAAQRAYNNDKCRLLYRRLFIVNDLYFLTTPAQLPPSPLSPSLQLLLLLLLLLKTLSSDFKAASYEYDIPHRIVCVCVRVCLRACLYVRMLECECQIARSSLTWEGEWVVGGWKCEVAANGSCLHFDWAWLPAQLSVASHTDEKSTGRGRWAWTWRASDGEGEAEEEEEAAA